MFENFCNICRTHYTFMTSCCRNIQTGVSRRRNMTVMTNGEGTTEEEKDIGTKPLHSFDSIAF